MATDAENERAQEILEAEAHRAKAFAEEADDMSVSKYLKIDGIDDTKFGRLMTANPDMSGAMDDLRQKLDGVPGLGSFMDMLSGDKETDREPVRDDMGRELNSLGDEVTGVRSDEPEGVSIAEDAPSPQRQAEDEGLGMA